MKESFYYIHILDAITPYTLILSAQENWVEWKYRKVIQKVERKKEKLKWLLGW